MGKCIARGYSQADITICENCFHKDVCGEKDYLTENSCCSHVEQGPPVRLPCKVGATIYEANKHLGGVFETKAWKEHMLTKIIPMWGKRYFGTREEAVAAMREKSEAATQQGGDGDE